MPRIYATPLDLPEALRDDENAEDLIRRASNLVTNTIASARFPTDLNGMPMDADLEACREAVVIQVSTWLSTGVNPLTGHGAKPKVVASKSTNGSTVAYVPDAAGAAFWTALAGGKTLVPDALEALAAEGLTTISLAPEYGRGRMYHPVPAGTYLIDGGEG